MPCDVTSRFYYHSNRSNLVGKKIMNHETVIEKKKVVSSKLILTIPTPFFRKLNATSQLCGSTVLKSDNVVLCTTFFFFKPEFVLFEKVECLECKFDLFFPLLKKFSV